MNVIKAEYEHYFNDALEQFEIWRNEGRKFPLVAFSSPFPQLFAFSDDKADLGNTISNEDFYLNLRFFFSGLSHVVEDGRMVICHLMNGINTKGRDGEISLNDSRGDFIRIAKEFDFVHWGEVFIKKDPRIPAQRKKTQQLMFGTLKKNALKTRPALVDNIIILKKKGESDTIVNPVDRGDVTFDTWCEWASGVWDNVSEGDVLKTLSKDGKSLINMHPFAKDNKDEKHITPTQLEFYRRCILMYSNPKEEVLDPFMGSGSAFKVALELNRKPVGIEVKESYFNLALKVAEKTVKEIAALKRQPTLFSTFIDETPNEIIEIKNL